MDQDEDQRKLREALAQRQSRPVPRINESFPPAAASDDAARQEASALAAGDLEAQSEANEHDRTERFRNHVAIAMLILFWLGFAAVVVVGAAWGINFLLPPEKAFFSATQSNSIFSFLTGGGLTSFIAGYAKKRLS